MLELGIAYAAGFLSAVAALYWILKPEARSKAEVAERAERRELHRSQYER